MSDISKPGLCVKARGEYLIIGLGRFGFSLALKLQELGHTVMAIDRDPTVVQEASHKVPQVVALDASDEDALREIGGEYFQTAIVAIGDDFESNILITALLKELGIPRIISKALTFRQRQILQKIGADQVVLPEHEAGTRLAAQLASRGHLLERLELQPGVTLSEVQCPDKLLGKSLGQLDLRKKLGLSVVAIQGARQLALPGPDEIFQKGDLLVVIGKDRDVARLSDWEGL